MAEQLVESLAADFDPKKYKDTWREEVLALLEKKAEGQEIVTEEPEKEPRGKVVNLMEALQRSLAAAKKGEARVAGGARFAGDGRRPKAAASGERRHTPEPEHRAAARAARASHPRSHPKN
jgi:DNA end-binding protein Ku